MEAIKISKIIDLAQAICTRVQEQDGNVSKTKLIKYLYLIDIEYYKVHERTYTGFNWIFYHYGPWTNEYEEIYSEMSSSPLFDIKVSGGLDFDTQFITSSEKKDLDSIFPPKEAMLELKVKRIVDRWACEGLSPLLNYVYFYTKPMMGAEKKETLDFTKILTFPSIPKFKLSKGSLSSSELKKIREKVQAKIREKKLTPKKDIVFTPPIYDDLYWQEIDKLNRDTEY
jgi:hypothetical protein